MTATRTTPAAAALTGVLTVVLIEALIRSRLVPEDASIGIVFPALFSIGVILVSRFAAQVDLDLDCVLYGEIAYAPLDVVFIGGQDVGPKALWVNVPILLVHGAADNNSGTFPMQSERMYDALKGHGATARLVMLPHESHGYRARESLMHLLWETHQWLERYVKNAPPREAGEASPAGQ